MKTHLRLQRKEKKEEQALLGNERSWEDLGVESQVAAVISSPGQSLDAATRALMEPRFGHDFSQIRIFDNDDAAHSADLFDARAYTVGSNIVFGAGEYAPETPAGQQLLAHELTHTIQQNAAQPPSEDLVVSQPGDAAEQEASHVASAVMQGQAFSPIGSASGLQLARAADLANAAVEEEGRMLDFITMKRKHIDLFGEDKYGHWWTELDDQESYGWWPKYPLSPSVGGMIDTLTGVEGELNGVTSFGGSPTQDPHHGDDAPATFNPVLTNEKSDDEVRNEIRNFASSYTGEWRWTFGFGQNCHTFQEELMEKVGLEEPEKRDQAGKR